MNHGSLFNGIGGFQLAAEWLGWNNIMSCEIDEFCSKVTKHHFPNCIQHGDIKTTDFSIYRGRIDILTGGFPCQPYSTAGKRKGKEDDRHLWPEMLRAIREISPRWVVGENVRGITNWNRGLVFDEVQADLEAEGYEITPFLLPASAVNAPHKRDRIWFVAHADGKRIRGLQADSKWQNIQEVRIQDSDGFAGHVGSWSAADAGRFRGGKGESEIQSEQSERNGIDSIGLQQSFANTKSGGMEGGGADRKQVTSTPIGSGLFRRDYAGNYWNIWPTQSAICSRNDGFPGGLDGITFSSWRKESLKSLGNAIVPQVAYQIFKAIQLFNDSKRSL